MSAPAPDVLYVGLQKTGSTYLRAYFSAHPQVVWTREAYRLQSTGLFESYLSAAREARSAAAQTNGTGVWIDMYESLGMGYEINGSERWSADAMITATCIHRAGRVTAVSPDLYERVRALLPRVRVLLTIRAQPEWMFSNFHHFVRLLPPDRRSFPHFLNSVEGKIIAAVASYDRLVERLFSVFGRERVLVLPMELLEEDAAQALNRVAAFLHVDDIPFTAADADFNRGIDHLYGQGRATIELPEEPPTRLRAFKERFLRPQPASAVPTKQALRGEFGDLLSALYAASNARLSQLIDCDLAALGYPV